jgi:biopolymer transport protein TolR
MAVQFTPAQRAYIRKRTKVHEPDIADLDEELNIVPFLDIVINLIMFLLMTISTAAFFNQVDTSLPKLGAGGAKGAQQENPLNLTVTVTREGVALTGSNGKILPGCREFTTTGRVVTVPNRPDGAFDWEGLTKCAAQIKETFKDEERVTVSADPAIVYQSLIDAMDAVRNDASGNPLFTEVLISAGVR